MKKWIALIVAERGEQSVGLHVAQQRRFVEY